MTTIDYVRFDFDDLRLADRTRIVGLMTALAAADFRFLKKAIVCDDMPGEIYVPSEPELLDRAWSNAVRAAPRYNGQYWMEFEGGSGLKLSFGMDPRRLKRLNLTLDRDRLKGPDASLALDSLLEAVRVICAVLQPAYGYGLFNYDVHDDLPPGAGPQGLWDINWYGARLAGTLDAERLQSADAWRCDAIADGVLLIPEADAFRRWPEAAVHRRQAATALGYERVFHDG